MSTQTNTMTAELESKKVRLSALSGDDLGRQAEYATDESIIKGPLREVHHRNWSYGPSTYFVIGSFSLSKPSDEWVTPR